MVRNRSVIAWLSFFPVEGLPDLPEPLQGLPKLHPATWQRVLLDELKSRHDLKFHVFAVRKHFDRHRSFEWEGVTFHCLKVPRGFRTLSLFWWETLLIRRVLKTIRPDMLHAWGTERGAAMVAARTGYPRLVTMQGLLNWCLQKVDLGPAVKLEAALERISLRQASLVTAESNFAVSWLQQHYPHLEVRQIEHAPNWLFHRLQRRPELRPLRLLNVAGLSLLKGSDLLLLALDKLRTELDFHLTIIGSAPAQFLARMKAATSAALWERITLRHGLSQAEVAEEMARATMVLFPTRADNSPNSVKEAVVAGVPVLASAIGGIVDYVVPERNGLTFPAENVDELAKAIRFAAAHPLFGQGKVDPATLVEMREYLSPTVMGARFYSAYQRVLESASYAERGTSRPAAPPHAPEG